MILVPPPPGPPSDSSWPDLDDLAQGPYVLVVEDDVELNLQLCWKLKEAGFRTKATHSATATLELIASRAPILMVLDYLLPDMAAGELIQRLAEKGQKVPFVVVTGHGDQRIAVEMFRLGARDYLVKDSGFLQLLPEVVARVVAQVETERQRDELERALRKSEERFRQMAAGISDALVIVEQGKVVYANEQAEVIFGRRFEELAGLSLLDIAAPSERERLAQAMKAIAEGALVPAELEYWVQRPDGTRCCVHSRYSHHAELDGSLTRYVLTTDITARKLAEEALRESEEKYRTVVEEAADGIAIVQDERVMFANRSAVAFVGMAEEQVIGRPVLDFIHPSEVPRLLALYRRIRSGERFPGINQTVLRRWDGQEVPIELSARVVGYQGKEAILVVFRDISARLNAERSTRYLAQLVTSVMDAVIATDLEGHIKTWNPAAERIYGWSEQEVLGLTVREVLRSEYPGTTREAVLEEIRTHGHWSGQALQYRKDGSQIWVYANSSLVRGTGGETLGIVRVNRDITAVRAAEQALRQSEQRLREAQRQGRIGYWEFDLQSQEITWSEETYRLYERDPLSGPPTVEEEAKYYSPETVQRLRDFAEQAVARGAEFEYDVEPILPSGRQALFHAKMKPIQDEEGRTVRLFGTVQDVTQLRAAQQALRENEERFRQFLNATTDVLYRYDPKANRYDFVSPSIEHFFGLSVEAVSADPRGVTRRMTHPADVEQAFRLAEDHIRKGPGAGPLVIEYRLIRPDGRVVWVSDRKDIEFLPDGRVHRINGVLRDVTKEKEAMQALAASQANYRAVVDSASDAILVIQDERVRFANPQAAELFGCPVESLAGRSIAELLQPEDWEQIRRRQTSPEGQLASRFSISVRGPGGQIRWVEAKIVSADWQGRAAKLFFLADVTRARELKSQLETQLAHMTQLSEAALEFLQMPAEGDIFELIAWRLSLLEGDCVVIVCSYEAETNELRIRAIEGSEELEGLLAGLDENLRGRVFPMSPDQLTDLEPNRIREARLDEPEAGDLLPVPREIMTLLHGRIGAVYHGVFAWQLGVLGTFCILRASSRPLEHTAVLEAFVRQAAIALERKHQAEELEKHRRRLAELVEQRTADLRQAQAELVRRERLAVLGQVAGSVAHELRNPLGVIRNVVSFLGMALGGHGHHQVRRNLELINRQIDRADRVLAALLDVTHGRAPQRTRVSASALITEAVGELARPEQVVVERIEPEGEQFILADSDQVRLAVGNVIRNAYEAMPSGGRLRIEVRPEGEMVALIFQDTGEGIGADVLPRIFEPLFTTKTVGAGLGLSICRAFVENNHGAVEVQSQPGEGTVVIVRLPAAP